MTDQTPTEPSSRGIDYSTVELDMKLAETALKVATFVSTRRDARQAVEWKMSFGVWTLLVAGLVKGFAVINWGLVLIPLLYGYWMQSIWVRHENDSHIMWTHTQDAQIILEKHGLKNPMHAWVAPAVNLKRKLGFLSGWASLMQFLITLALTLLLFTTAAETSLYRLQLNGSDTASSPEEAR